jgi:hypothetical protein
MADVTKVSDTGVPDADNTDIRAPDAGTCEFLDGALGTCNDPTAPYVCCPYLPGQVGCVSRTRFEGGGCQPPGTP